MSSRGDSSSSLQEPKLALNQYQNTKNGTDQSCHFEWPILALAEYADSPEYSFQFSPPEELKRMPEGEKVPIELVNILSWSLKESASLANEGGPRVAEEEAREVGSPKRQSYSMKKRVISSEEDCYNNPSSFSEPPEILFDDGGLQKTPLLSRDITPIGPALEQLDDPPPYENLNRERSPSLSSRRSSSSNIRFPRLRHSHYGLLSSTTELLHALKSKIEDTCEKKGQPKSCKESTSLPTVECASCFEELSLVSPTLVTLPCTHHYCRSCMVALITTSMNTECLYPPKCCLTPIPLQIIIKTLEKKERDAYKGKAAEYAIPADRRWYCPNTKDCGRWIPPKRLRCFSYRGESRLSCPFCECRICGICRGIAHEQQGEDGLCPHDTGLKKTLATAQAEGWQRCYNCRAIVELNAGCRHITCRCKAEFCYICCSKWGSCGCTELDMERKRAKLRAAKARRDQERRREEEEVAEAVRRIEEMERKEEERRAEEAREREEMARQEKERIAEEEREAKAREESEKLRREDLKRHLLEKMMLLADKFNLIVQFQQQTLIERHCGEEKELELPQEEAERPHSNLAVTMLAQMEANIEKRRTTLRAKQEKEMADLKAKHDAADDDFFMQVQVHLRGKLNREEREEKMRHEFKNLQEEELERLQQKQEEQWSDLDQYAQMEKRGVELFIKSNAEDVKKERAAKANEIVAKITAERKWFEIVSKRRRNMLERHGRLTLEEFEQGLEQVIGLTAEKAAMISPLPKILDSCPPPATHQTKPNDEPKRDSFKEVIGVPQISIHQSALPELRYRNPDDLFPIPSTHTSPTAKPGRLSEDRIQHHPHPTYLTPPSIQLYRSATHLSAHRLSSATGGNTHSSPTSFQLDPHSIIRPLIMRSHTQQDPLTLHLLGQQRQIETLSSNLRSLLQEAIASTPIEMASNHTPVSSSLPIYNQGQSLLRA